MNRVPASAANRIRLVAIGAIVCLHSKKVSLLLLSGLLLLGVAATAQALPTPTWGYWGLAERLEKSKSAVLVKFLSTTEGGQAGAGSTSYEVLRVLKDPRKVLTAGRILELPGALRAGAGEWRLLLEYDLKGAQAEVPEWMEGHQVSETSFQYITQAPPRSAAATRRMEYYFPFLGNAEKQIADDAYWVFSREFRKEIIPFAKKLSPEKLRRLVFDENAVANREHLDLFAMMLGWCGTDADAERMAALIRKPPKSEDDPRLEMRGLLFGYLLLARADGLKVVEDIFSRPQGPSTPAIVSKIAAIQSLTFMWSYGEGRIPPGRLRDVMRKAMAHPDTEEMAIESFAELKDWEMQAELFQRYSQDGVPRPVKGAIIRYMWASTRDVDPAQASPNHVTRGQEYLQKFRKLDPKYVSSMEELLHEREELLKGRGLRKQRSKVETKLEEKID